MCVVVDGAKVGTLTAKPGWDAAQPGLLDIGKKAPVVIELLTYVEEPPGAETRSLGVAIDWLRLEPAKDGYSGTVCPHLYHL